MAFEKSWWSRPRASSLDEMDADAEKRYLFEEMQALNSFRMRDVWTRGFEPRLVLHSVRRGASCFRIARFAFVILAAMCIEMYIHNQTLTIKSPAKPVDAPFHVGCVEPDTRAPRENGVIVMLANNNDLSTAMRTIGNFEQRFNGWYGYPYVLFNDQPWDPDFISTLTSMDLLRGRNVTFETLASNIWGWPEWMTEETKKSAQAAMHDSKVMYAGKESYHHMCRFFAGKFYDHPALASYKWYWRLDSDVDYLCSMTYDPFVEMAKHGKKYGYAMSLWELGTTAPSLYKAFERYRRENLISRSNTLRAMLHPNYVPWPFRKLLTSIKGRDDQGDAWNWCHFWSNFEIADLDWYRSKEYRQLFDYLDHDGGLYFERWGDAPIHSLAAAMLLKPEELHYFSDFGYHHDNLQRTPGNAPRQQLLRSPQISHLDYDQVETGGLGCRCKADADALHLAPWCQDRFDRAMGA